MSLYATNQLLRILKAKAGIRLDATGYGLFQHYSTKGTGPTQSTPSSNVRHTGLKIRPRLFLIICYHIIPKVYFMVHHNLPNIDVSVEMLIGRINLFILIIRHPNITIIYALRCGHL